MQLTLVAERRYLCLNFSVQISLLYSGGLALSQYFRDDFRNGLASDAIPNVSFSSVDRFLTRDMWYV